MLIKTKFEGYTIGGFRKYYFDMGGDSAAAAPTSQTLTQTSIPEYAKPYVEGMLGKAQTLIDQPYQAYTQERQAGFTPLQQQAQAGIAGLQMPGQYGQASGMAAAAGQGAMDSANQAYGFGAQGQQSGMTGQNLGIQGGAQYGGMGAGYGQQAAGLAGQALGAGNLSSQIGQMGLQAQQTGQQIGNQAQNYAAQAAAAGQNYANQATDPNAMQAYMSPYMQNVVDVQNREAARASGIQGTQQQAQAAAAGAYGGGRDAIMRAERERNLAMLQNQNQAQGMQAAYQQAQQAQQYGAGLGLQGLSGAQQGLGTALQGGQLGLSGIGTALQGQQGQQAGISGANQAYQTGIQGAGMGLQGVNAQLAGTAQGMQGAQVGLQGVAGAQAGYGLANQAAGNLANIGTQQQASNLGILNAQTAAGAQQQAAQQAALTQQYQDFLTQKQAPYQQLGYMSDMLRGLPMSQSASQIYQAPPSAASTLAGVGTAAYGLSKLAKKGGSVKDIKKQRPAGLAELAISKMA